MEDPEEEEENPSHGSLIPQWLLRSMTGCVLLIIVLTQTQESWQGDKRNNTGTTTIQIDFLNESQLVRSSSARRPILSLTTTQKNENNGSTFDVFNAFEVTSCMQICSWWEQHAHEYNQVWLTNMSQLETPKLLHLHLEVDPEHTTTTMKAALLEVSTDVINLNCNDKC
eukprot:TRINITY_DN8388_c0_g3_i1.p1 TRINITY_DN8388_c0_g3~~TRINITY_DN8388_c0_g3_i1.p1  ORF type:complete len:169 (+),score=29.87 TRINITY_DN8388_c0_g3_i1:94-600(+)